MQSTDICYIVEVYQDHKKLNCTVCHYAEFMKEQVQVYQTTYPNADIKVIDIRSL